MLESLIRFFASRHLLVNLLTVLMFVAGVFAWRNTAKEELPNVSFNWVGVYAAYPGAPADDVEKLVTIPLEEAVQGLDGVRKVDSTSSVGSASLSVEIEPFGTDLETVVTDIRNAVLDVRLPLEVEDEPWVRVWRTSRKAIIDIGLYLEGERLLDFASRQELQQAARALENQFLVQPEIHNVYRRGYLMEEIEVRARPAELNRYRIGFDSVMRAIRANHLRQPAGTLDDGQESKVTLGAELDDPEVLKGLIVQGGFEGHGVRLDKLADVVRGHEDTNSVMKVNGHEGVMLNVVKSAQAGILEALSAVYRVLDQFMGNQGAGGKIRMVLLDDESTDLRNRLSIITMNGAIGFTLILIILFLFLDVRSGVWVAVGIPFTFCFSMVVLSLLGFTINNMTLAGVIIVMGMVVDDAIIVAENVHRTRERGLPPLEAAVRGTRAMTAPITAAVLTTCAAFVPLFFMEGRWSQMNKYIPAVIFVMLAGSLLESVLILPAHLIQTWGRFAWIAHFLGIKAGAQSAAETREPHWFKRWEKGYGNLLDRLLPQRNRVYAAFLMLMVMAGLIFWFRLKFVMFPHEETREISVEAEAPPGTLRLETARLAEAVEDVFLAHVGKEVVGYRTDVARSRRGGARQENIFRTVVEIVPKEKRDMSADELIAKWEAELKGNGKLSNIEFAKSRWGQESGNPIEVVIRSNDDAARFRGAETVRQALAANPELANVEIEEDLRVPEYKVSLKRDLLKRLSVDAQSVASTLRAALQGSLVYEIIGGDEEVRVRFTADRKAKENIDDLLSVPVENRSGYLVPLKDLVDVEKRESSTSITRREGRRITRVFAGLAEGGSVTPEEAARSLERDVFPKLLAAEPTISVEFDGEIRETRETKGDLKAAVVVVVVLIYVILAVLFDSLVKPVVIMLAIPFGAVGVILAFAAHGIVEFGFFAAIGAMGLSGVVVNDSIVMVFRIGKALKEKKARSNPLKIIAAAAQTRLKAVILTTLTTVAALFPTAYGLAGYDHTLAQMMLAMAWGLIFGTAISLVLVPCLYATLALRGDREVFT